LPAGGALTPFVVAAVSSGLDAQYSRSVAFDAFKRREICSTSDTIKVKAAFLPLPPAGRRRPEEMVVRLGRCSRERDYRHLDE
jgi:hypothetical protein